MHFAVSVVYGPPCLFGRSGELTFATPLKARMAIADELRLPLGSLGEEDRGFIDALLARTPPPDHILIETSGLALPKPLLKAFNWPVIRSRITVDGVIAVADAEAWEEVSFTEPAATPPMQYGLALPATA